MFVERNDCVECDLPCTDCGLKHAQHRVCDVCEAEEQLYKSHGKELCIDCIEESSQALHICSECGVYDKVFYHDGKCYCHECLTEILEKVK